MRTVFPLFVLFLSGTFLPSCQSQKTNDDEVVAQTVHRYGVSLDLNDWSARGQNGQVISVRKDGVTVVRNFDAGILDGESTYSYPYREMVQKKEIYVRGHLSQDWTYYPNGAPSEQTDYLLGSVKSVTSWYESGAPYAKETFQNNKLIEGQYMNPDHTMDSLITNGEGTKTVRDAYGQLLSVDTYKNGTIISSTTYHANGAPQSITPYNNGVVHGERRTYMPGGEPATVENWSKGSQNGTTVVFEYGEKRSEIPYVNGCRQGVEKRFCDDGKTVIQEWTWANDQKHGPVYTYVGNTTKTDWYFCNRQVPNKATFDMLNNQ